MSRSANGSMGDRDIAGGFLAWSDEAPTIMLQPHDRPATAARCPCVTWGFATRPEPEADPLLTKTPDAETKARRAWEARVERFVKLFDRDAPAKSPGQDHGPFRAVQDGDLRLPLIGDIEGAAGALSGMRSRNFNFDWRGIPCVLEVQFHAEFAHFLIIMSPHLHRRDFRTDPNAAEPWERDIWPDEGRTWTRLIDELRMLGDAKRVGDTYYLPDITRGPSGQDHGWPVTEKEDFEREVNKASDFVYKDVWRLLIADLAAAAEQASREAETIGGRLEFGRRRDEALVPGEAFSSLRLAVTGPIEPLLGHEIDASDQPDPMVDANGLAPRRMERFLAKREPVLKRVFAESPDREFIAHGAQRSRHVFVSSLSSSLPYAILKKTGGVHTSKRMREAGVELLRDEDAGPRALLFFIRDPAPPIRASVQRELSDDAAAAPVAEEDAQAAAPGPYEKLSGEPEVHQLGRLLERLHSVELFRAAALLDLNAIDRYDRALRHVGRSLDAINIRNIGDSRRVEGAALREVFRQIKAMETTVDGEDAPRGGLSYRVSRASLYVQTLDRRLGELKIAPIPTWQPLDEFIARRAQRRFDTIAELGDRRDRLLRRLTLLVENLQWDELNEVQNDAAKTLQAADFIAYFSAAFGASAVGATIGSVANLDLIVEYFQSTVMADFWPWYRGALTAFGHTSLESEAESNPYGGAYFGGAVGIVICLLLFVNRWLSKLIGGLRRWIDKMTVARGATRLNDRGWKARLLGAASLVPNALQWARYLATGVIIAALVLPSGLAGDLVSSVWDSVARLVGSLWPAAVEPTEPSSLGGVEQPSDAAAGESAPSTEE